MFELISSSAEFLYFATIIIPILMVGLIVADCLFGSRFGGNPRKWEAIANEPDPTYPIGEMPTELDWNLNMGSRCPQRS